MEYFDSKGRTLNLFVWPLEQTGLLGRPLGHFIFSLIGLKRILFTNIFQRL